MSRCAEVNGLLPLSAGGDLDAPTQDRVSEHLARCAACRAEEALFRSMIHSVSNLFSNSYEIPAASRSRIARQAAERASRSRWPAWLPAPVLPGRAGLLAAAAVLVVAMAVPASLRIGGDGPSTGREGAAFMEIEVRADEAGTVRLAWSNGRKGTYTVYKSHDPRLFSHSEAHVVAGNVWTDEDAASAPIVYYRIE